MPGTSNDCRVPDRKGSKLAVALPIQRNKEIVAVLIGELEDEPMKKSLFTRAFGDKTCNMVFDGNGRLLFSAAPPGSLDRLFPQMAEKGLPTSLREHLLIIFSRYHACTGLSAVGRVTEKRVSPRSYSETLVWLRA